MILIPFLLFSALSAPRDAMGHRSRRHRKSRIEQGSENPISHQDFNFDMPQDGSFDQIDDSFPNTDLRQDGSRVCKKGYISDSTIDKRGCWKCDKECDSVSQCSYPGNCIARIPKINNYNVKNINKSNFVVVNYRIPNFYFKKDPKQAFCKYDDSVVEATVVNVKQIFCPSIDSPFTKLAISFDQQSWSPIQGANQQKSSGLPYIIIGIVIGVVIVGLAGFAFLLKNKKVSKAPHRESNSKPLAYFPIVEDGEKKPSYY